MKKRMEIYRSDRHTHLLLVLLLRRRLLLLLVEQHRHIENSNRLHLFDWLMDTSIENSIDDQNIENKKMFLGWELLSSLSYQNDMQQDLLVDCRSKHSNERTYKQFK